MKYLASVLLLFAVTLGACAHSPTEESLDDGRNLQMCVRKFHKDMRWRRWEAAAESIVPAHRQAFLGRYQELGDDFHISDLEIKSLTREKDKAIIDIQQEYYKEPANIVKKKRFIEVWKKVDGGWMVDQRMPKKEYKKMKEGEKKAEKKAKKNAEKNVEASSSSEKPQAKP